MNEVMSRIKEQMIKAVEHLNVELNNIRTGRAHAGILDGVMVEVYGMQMRITDVASINIPESRQLLITPFDANNSNVIAKSIEKANLGFQVIADGNTVRMIIPPMDQSIRKDMVKQCGKKAEEAKVSIRSIRREANDIFKEMKKSGSLPEDDEKRREKEVQELTDKYCKNIDEIIKRKENEILEI